MSKSSRKASTAFEFNTLDYYDEHGRGPSGYGEWDFCVPMLGLEVMQSRRMRYCDAKKWIKKVCRLRGAIGAVEICVCP